MSHFLAELKSSNGDYFTKNISKQGFTSVSQSIRARLKAILF